MVNEIGAQQHQLVVTFLGLPQSPCRVIADKIGRRPVTCEDLGRDRYKRIIGRCTVAGEDLSEWMVSQGLALAYRRYSLDYVDEEADAQAARRGIGAGEFVKPWEWPRGGRPAAEAARRVPRKRSR